MLNDAQRSSLDTLLAEVFARPLRKCFVRGCNDASFVTRVHKHFGVVSACGSHDPERTAMAVPMFLPPPAPTEAPAADERHGLPEMTFEERMAAMFTELVNMAKGAGKDDDGRKTRLIKPKPGMPPGGVGLIPSPPKTAEQQLAGPDGKARGLFG